MDDVSKKLLKLVNIYRENCDWRARSIRDNNTPTLTARKLQEELLELGVELDIPEQPKYIVREVYNSLGSIGSKKMRVRNPEYRGE